MHHLNGYLPVSHARGSAGGERKTLSFCVPSSPSPPPNFTFLTSAEVTGLQKLSPAEVRSGAPLQVCVGAKWARERDALGRSSN